MRVPVLYTFQPLNHAILTFQLTPSIRTAAELMGNIDLL